VQHGDLRGLGLVVELQELIFRSLGKTGQLSGTSDAGQGSQQHYEHHKLGE